MGTVRFILRTDKTAKKGLFSIDLVYQKAGRRVCFRTTEKVNPVNWSSDLQLAKYVDKNAAKRFFTSNEKFPSLSLDGLFSKLQISEINSVLLNLRRRIADIEKNFESEGLDYTAAMVVSGLKATPPAKDLFVFIDEYITANQNTREPGSLGVYKTLKTHLKNYQAARRKVLTFETIDYAFFSDFQNYLLSLTVEMKDGSKVPRLNNITVAKQLSTVKTFLNYAKKNGVKINERYRDFKIKKESLEVIALTQDEFNKLYNLDLTGNKKLRQVRDVFIFSCCTGLRYSDLAQLKREHIKPDGIRLVVTKTKQHLYIPLNSFSNSILSNYNDQLKPLPVISNQKTNTFLKELCKKAGIDETVQIVRFRGSKREEAFYKKYELVSIHTGRKTFATLSLEKGMSAEVVMRIGGWQDYRSFKRYVNITEKTSKSAMDNFWGSVPVLKAV